MEIGGEEGDGRGGGGGGGAWEVRPEGLSSQGR